MVTTARRTVRCDEYAKGGWHALSSDVWYWHDGIKNFRHFIPFAQNDWAKEDAAGTSALSFPFDSGTGRISAEINPSVIGTHLIRKRIIAPRDFGIFAPTDPIVIVTKRSGAVTSVKATLFNGATMDPTVNGVDVSPAVSGTWETHILFPTGVYNPGDFMTFQIEYISSTIGVTVDTADLAMAYKTNRGNI